MMLKIVFVIVAIASVTFTEAELRQKHPDVGLNVKQLIRKYKYPFEKHTTTTADDYILEIHRIPHGRNNNKSEDQPVVYIMPGTLCSSADWVNMGPEKSLGFILADRGYDVWLGNYRGSTWSRQHVTLDPNIDKKEFFDFSFHDIGYYDAPASIDYILNVTKQEKLFYIGHSQGTTSFFVMTSLRPEYNNKIRLMSGLAPVIYSDNLEHPLVPMLVSNLKLLEATIDKYEYYEALRHTPLTTILGQMFCNDDSDAQDLCAGVLFLISGFTPENTNKTMIPVITSNAPAGAATKMLLHFAQGYLAKKFQQYDYGEEENMRRYDQATPPDYDLQKITAPLAFYYSDSDWLLSEIDVKRSVAELSNVVEVKLIEGLNHQDYLWAIKIEEKLYKHVIDLMDSY